MGVGVGVGVGVCVVFSSGSVVWLFLFTYPRQYARERQFDREKITNLEKTIASLQSTAVSMGPGSPSRTPPWDHQSAPYCSHSASTYIHSVHTNTQTAHAYTLPLTTNVDLRKKSQAHVLSPLTLRISGTRLWTVESGARVAGEVKGRRRAHTENDRGTLMGVPLCALDT